MSRLAFLNVVAMPADTRVSKTNLTSIVAMPANSLATKIVLIQVQSADRAFYLDFFDSTSEIYNLGLWEVSLTAGPIPEFNPYKPQVPEELLESSGREVYDWQEENQKTLRMQHNLIQAGDTTFPWQMFQTAHTEKIYTLGSMSRFYHEDFGLILARYVRFDKMDKTVNAAAPVGLIANTGKLDWVVTNRLEISSPDLVVGINAAFITPDDGQYGWAIVDGVNLQPLTNVSGSHALGETFVWSASGQISNAGSGVTVARRLNKSTNITLLQGQAHIRIESLSKGSIIDALEAFIDDVAQLKLDVESLKDAVDIADTLQGINASITVLRNRLTSEEVTRRAADTAINNRISNLAFVTGGQLGTAVSQLQNAITTLQTTLTASIAAAKGIALEALQKANQALALNLGAIEIQISTILEMIRVLDERPKGKFPVVDGEIPPNLVYLDDGSLVYEETL